LFLFFNLAHSFGVHSPLNVYKYFLNSALLKGTHGLFCIFFVGFSDITWLTLIPWHFISVFHSIERGPVCCFKRSRLFILWH